MFSFFKRLKQINGYEPIDKKHLAQYSYMCSFKPNKSVSSLEFDNHQRMNSDIWLYVYETNSFKIIIKNRLNTQEFHLTALPYMSKGYETYKTILDEGDTEVLIGVNERDAMVSFGDIGCGIKFYNKL